VSLRLASGFEMPVYTGLGELVRRYDRRSVLALVCVLAVMGLVGLTWMDLFLAFPFVWTDWLLWGSWGLMIALLCWDVRPKRDVALAVAGFALGLLAEWWGTVTELWTYFTLERPPAWILFAWPIATLAIDRVGRLFTTLTTRLPRIGVWYWTAMTMVFVAFAFWAAPAIREPASWVVAGVAVVTLLTSRTQARDVALLLGGTALGCLLERWGTTRGCWIYYTGETPPPIACVAHGFVAVMANRTLDLGARLLDAMTKRGVAQRPRRAQ
jgi:hypothetical protein